MEGYFWPKSKKEREELHLLELDDCCFIPDDEIFMRPRFNRKYICHRCGSITHITSEGQYCSGCNWDSLTDLTCENTLTKIY